MDTGDQTGSAVCSGLVVTKLFCMNMGTQPESMRLDTVSPNCTTNKHHLGVQDPMTTARPQSILGEWKLLFRETEMPVFNKNGLQNKK